MASALLALVGLVVLVIYSPPNPLARVALLTYGLSLVLLFAASTTYHLVKTTPARELLLRKLDHTAIYLLIAGTYTPVCAIVLLGAWRWGLLIVIWSRAALGIACQAHEKAGHAAWLMAQHAIGHVPVVAADQLLGLVTRRDLIRLLAEEDTWAS